MNVFSSSKNNINEGCSKQELVHPPPSSCRTVSGNVDLTERQIRKIQQKNNKEAALAKRKAQVSSGSNLNHSITTKEIKTLAINPQDSENSLSDDDSLIDESEGQVNDSSRIFQDVTQESKDLYSNIKSEGQVINILSFTSLDEALKGKYELQGECGVILEGYEMIGEIGHGAHGKILKLRKEAEKDKVIKLYRKIDEKEFLVEASILANLKRITQGGIGISTFLRTQSFYGILMLAGVGTLGDFRDFMREEKISFAEDELLFIHMGLMRNYTAIRQTSVFHRDMKLSNIILHPKDLNLEIIDYSFAVYADSKRKYQGYVGTLGFIAPHIYHAEEEYGDERLLKGDLFSIGITVLCLADLDFRLEQQSIRKRAQRSLRKISQKKRLCKILKGLIFDCKDITEKQAKSMYPNHNVGYFSGLSKHHDRFKAYLETRQCKSLNTQDELKIISLSSQPENHQDIVYVSRKRNEFEREQKGAANNYLLVNEERKARNCYELILKNYTISGELEAAKPYFYEIYSGLFSGKSASWSPLFYSTLGVYLYLVKDYEKAKFLFKTGLKQCNEKYDTLILLNNYAYACFAGHDDSVSLQEAYEIIKTGDSLENISLLVGGWLQSFKSQKQRVTRIPNENESQRQYEMVLTSYQLAETLNPQSVKTDRFYEKVFSFIQFDAYGATSKVFGKDEELIFIAFINYCKSKANVLATFFEKSNKELFEEIKQFCWSLNQEYYSQISFKPDLGLFSIIFEFNSILLNCEKWSNELNELYEEVLLFDKYKDTIFQLADKEARDAFFKKFLRSELLMTLAGFIAKFSGSTINTFSKASIYHIQRKISFFLKFTESVEISIPKMVTENSSNLYFLLENLFDSDSALNLQIEGLKLLGQAGWLVSKSKFRVQSDSSNIPNKYQSKLFHLSLSSSENLIKKIKLPIVPKAKIMVENLRLYVKQEDKFHQKEAVLHEILSQKSLLKLELELAQGMNKKLHFDDNFVKQTVKFICSLERLESLRVRIFDGHITAEGIKYLEKMIKELKHLRSLTMIFISCPYITNPSIQSFIQTIDTFSQLEFLSLEFQICSSISIEKIAEYKNEMKSHLKEKSILIVQPAIDLSSINA